jgi:hypothetical protein
VWRGEWGLVRLSLLDGLSLLEGFIDRAIEAGYAPDRISGGLAGTDLNVTRRSTEVLDVSNQASSMGTVTE